MNKKIAYKTDCTYFSGFTPCREHKKSGQECHDCPVYKPLKMRILIIKTGAAGDVIRTTPILHKLKSVYPQAAITWMTLYPDLVPKEAVDKILLFNWENSLTLLNQQFELVINLDKSTPEAALASKIKTEKLIGFTADENGNILPADENAYNKWETGINDQAMRANKKHFVEEIFEICGWSFAGEEYWRPASVHKINIRQAGKKTIGLNTGCGERWLTRLWSDQRYKELTRLLINNGYHVVLLGGPAEHEKNLALSAETGAAYHGVQSLPVFMDFIQQCDLVVTSVTMALHMAIAAKTKTILLNNIFPKNEFHMYGAGRILEPDISCKSCYKNKFDSRCVQQNCLDLVTSAQVFEQIESQIGLTI